MFQEHQAELRQGLYGARMKEKTGERRVLSRGGYDRKMGQDHARQYLGVLTEKEIGIQPSRYFVQFM